MSGDARGARSGAAVTAAPSRPFEASVGGGRARSGHEDPWGPVLGLGDRAVKIGALIGLFLALSTHGYMSGRAMLALYDMQKGVGLMRASIHEFLWTEYDVDLKPEKAPEPEKKADPPPEPEPEPVAVPQPKADKPQDDPYEPEKAAPVQAAKILTAPPDPNQIEDLTGQGIVSGNATDGPLGGQSSAVGTSTIISKNPNVSNTGKPGGTGNGDVPKPAPTVAKVDLSKTATVVGSLSWNCPFPAEADDEQIDFAQVTLVVTVRADGSPQSVQVIGDPGHGFGRAARLCALARKYSAGLDSNGNATVKSTPPIRVSFTR